MLGLQRPSNADTPRQPQRHIEQPPIFMPERHTPQPRVPSPGHPLHINRKPIHDIPFQALRISAIYHQEVKHQGSISNVDANGEWGGVGEHASCGVGHYLAVECVPDFGAVLDGHDDLAGRDGEAPAAGPCVGCRW